MQVKERSTKENAGSRRTMDRPAETLVESDETPTTRARTAIDLFCGCGGMTEGLKQAGFRVLWGIDAAEKPMVAYQANHQEVRTETRDIRLIDCTELMATLGVRQGELDLLAGCPPCQGFSSMRTRNRRKPVEDSRNDLVFEFLRFVESFLPKAVMMENVPGLARDARFTRFCRDMLALGYEGGWKILNVADAGVPQRRRRLIYLAGRKTTMTIEETKAKQVTVREAIGSLPQAGSSGDPLHDLPENRSDRIQRMIRLVPLNGGSRSELPAEYVLPCHERNPGGFNDVYGRMAWDSPSPTITGGCASPSKGRFLHPEAHRCITLREAAVLQGFPIDYVFPVEGMTKQDLALMIGNALPVPFIRSHAESILHQLRATDGSAV